MPVAPALRQHQRIRRPFGSDAFMAKVERVASRLLRKQKPGPMRQAYGGMVSPEYDTCSV